MRNLHSVKCPLEVHSESTRNHTHQAKRKVFFFLTAYINMSTADFWRATVTNVTHCTDFFFKCSSLDDTKMWVCSVRDTEFSWLTDCGPIANPISNAWPLPTICFRTQFQKRISETMFIYNTVYAFLLAYLFCCWCVLHFRAIIDHLSQTWKTPVNLMQTNYMEPIFVAKLD